MTFSLLLYKYLNDELRPDELKEFLEALSLPEHREMLIRALDEKLQVTPTVPLISSDNTQQLFRSVLQQAEEFPATISRRRRLLRRRMALARAAVLVLALAGAAWYFWPRPAPPTTMASARPAPAVPHDVQPGTNKAVLTLGDGSTVELGAGARGTLAHQGSADVVQLRNGELSYQASGKDLPVVYNTMATPAGGQYEVILPDETHVWLNASSSLTYPTAFRGGERVVALKGEGYFEVAPDSHAPFSVQVSGMMVNVLGTHFNVNAYDDESIKRTTLLQGAIQVVTSSGSTQLSQGQQVTATKEGVLKLVADPDIDESIAWKKGLFSFNNADLAFIMRQFARWYNLTVRYEGPMSKRRFTGDVFRNLKLSEALKVLELNDVHFRIEGNNLTVIQ